MDGLTADGIASLLGAVATLIAGILAVGAAVFVGLRQAKIMDEQKAIAGRQVELERQKFRGEMFDRRMQVYEATVRWLQVFWAEGSSPSGETKTNYIWAMEKAKFLFRPILAEQMDHWFRVASKHDLLAKTGDFEKVAPLSDELWAVAKTVNALFAEDMAMTDSEPLTEAALIQPPKKLALKGAA